MNFGSYSIKNISSQIWAAKIFEEKSRVKINVRVWKILRGWLKIIRKTDFKSSDKINFLIGFSEIRVSKVHDSSALSKHHPVNVYFRTHFLMPQSLLGKQFINNVISLNYLIFLLWLRAWITVCFTSNFLISLLRYRAFNFDAIPKEKTFLEKQQKQTLRF